MTKIKKDVLTEMQYGKGAIKTCGKILLYPGGKSPDGFDMTRIFGAVADDLMSNTTKKKHCKGEMWECELIIIPIRKFINNKEEQWDVLSLDQQLSSAWGNRESWEKEITEGE